MASISSRLERLEREQRFQTWFVFERFLEGLTEEQLEAIAIDWRFPEPLPQPLPPGASRLDGLNRNALLRLWEESELETARLMDEMKGRSRDECKFHLDHEHWPERPCDAVNCHNARLEDSSEGIAPDANFIN